MAGRRPPRGPRATAGRARSGPGRRPAGRSRPRARRSIRRASSSSAIERRVEGDGHDLRWRDEPGDPLVELDERAELGDRERRLGQVVEVVLGEARLVDEDHRVRRRAVDEPQRHGAVGRVVDGALALDEDPVAARLALLDEPLDRAVGEVADRPIDGHAPALDHHPGLAGRDHGGRHAVAAGRRRPAPARPTSCRCAQSVPTVRITRLPGQVPPADRRLHPVRRPPVVDERDAGGGGGRGELRVVAQELVEAGMDVEAGRDGLERIAAASSGGSLPPVGAMPMSRPSGRTGPAERLVEAGHERDVAAGQELAAGSARPSSSRGWRRCRRGRSG